MCIAHERLQWSDTRDEAEHWLREIRSSHPRRAHGCASRVQAGGVPFGTSRLSRVAKSSGQNIHQRLFGTAPGAEVRVARPLGSRPPSGGSREVTPRLGRVRLFLQQLSLMSHFGTIRWAPPPSDRAMTSCNVTDHATSKTPYRSAASLRRNTSASANTLRLARSARAPGRYPGFVRVF